MLVKENYSRYSRIVSAPIRMATALTKLRDQAGGTKICMHSLKQDQVLGKKPQYPSRLSRRKKLVLIEFLGKSK